MTEMNIKASINRYNDPNRVPVTEAANHLYELVRDIQEGGHRKLITKHGKVIAAITPLSEVAIVDEIMSGKRALCIN